MASINRLLQGMDSLAGVLYSLGVLYLRLLVIFAIGRSTITFHHTFSLSYALILPQRMLGRN